jgi:hypothetical protein
VGKVVWGWSSPGGSKSGRVMSSRPVMGLRSVWGWGPQSGRGEGWWGRSSDLLIAWLDASTCAPIEFVYGLLSFYALS